MDDDKPDIAIISPRIECFKQQDYGTWLALWDANNQGQSHPATTAETWKRILDPAIPVYGLGAYIDDNMAGLLHYILHPVTGHINPVCYMQDVFVDPAQRRKGVAKALIAELARTGKTNDWARIYWLAENDNIAAQNLYRTIGVKLNFSLHVLPL